MGILLMGMCFLLSHGKIQWVVCLALSLLKMYSDGWKAEGERWTREDTWEKMLAQIFIWLPGEIQAGGRVLEQQSPSTFLTQIYLYYVECPDIRSTSIYKMKRSCLPILALCSCTEKLCEYRPKCRQSCLESVYYSGWGQTGGSNIR